MDWTIEVEQAEYRSMKDMPIKYERTEPGPKMSWLIEEGKEREYYKNKN